MSPPFERRRCDRYSIRLDVRFRIRKRGGFIEGGQGTIRDVSRTGVFLESPLALPPGTVLQLTVDWPVRFRGKTRVDWIVDAVVVRSSFGGVAATIMRHQFKRRTGTQKESLAG